MTISCGMRAAKGAIESVRIREDGELLLGTIGGGRPAGICGSGLLDAVSECVGFGAIDRKGKFAIPNGRFPPSFRERLVRHEGKPAFILTDGVSLLQKDIRQVQLAKAAVRAGADLLLQKNGIGYGDVDRVLIAGAFGYHLQTKSLTGIGMLPREAADKIEFVGNTSRSGAQAILLDRSTRDELSALVENVGVLELANVPEFERTFIDALAF